MSSLQVEQSKLKEISEVATTQVRAFESQQISRDKGTVTPQCWCDCVTVHHLLFFFVVSSAEVTSLRQQLLDFQAQSDEKTIIGKLHRHIVRLQVSEGIALRKLDDAVKKTYRLEAQLLRAEQRLDDKEQTIYHNRMEARSKTRYLRNTVFDLRQKYAGAVPLNQQERFAEQMVKLTEEKRQIEEDLRKVKTQQIVKERRTIC